MIARTLIGHMPLEVVTNLYPIAPTTASTLLLVWHTWNTHRPRWVQ